MTQFQDGQKSLRSDMRKLKETWEGTLKWIDRSEKEARAEKMAAATILFSSPEHTLPAATTAGGTHR